MVPPASDTNAWGALSRARGELRDPGLFRWPPHANLLYPFLELKSAKGAKESDNDGDMFDADILESLARATGRCEPFNVSLEKLGVFGGRSRGVLWIYPRSHTSALVGGEVLSSSMKVQKVEDTDNFCDSFEPLIRLQASLEEEFPACSDQRKQGTFTPHLTISHFESLDDASKAKLKVEQWWTPVTFHIAEIYVLRRVGDDGQFEIAATVPLGCGGPSNHYTEVMASENVNTCNANDLYHQAHKIQIHNPPIRFPLMPASEEDWVKEERMNLKARRNRGRRQGGNRRKGRRSGSQGQRGNEEYTSKKDDNRVPSRSTDTAEEIAAKREARKAKRERLEKETS